MRPPFKDCRRNPGIAPAIPVGRGWKSAYDQLAKLPDGAIFINTARGEVVDEPALIQCLTSGKLFAAGVDTTMEEPIPADSPLFNLDNLIVTPHVGGSTPAALAAMATCAVTNVLGFLNGNPPPASFCVNPQVFNR